MKSHSFRNLAILILVNLLWAGEYPAYKIASRFMSPQAINFWSLLFGILVLLPFRWRARRHAPATKPATRPRDIVDFLLLGVFGILPPSLVLSWGIARSTAANAAIIQLTIPVLMAVLAAILLSEKFTLVRGLSLVVALAGTLVASTEELAAARIGAQLLVGNIAIFLAGLGSAFFNTYAKRLLPTYGELTVLNHTYAVACLGCGAVALFTDPKSIFAVASMPAELWLSLFALGCLTWGIAMVLWMWLLNRLEAMQLAASVYMLPVFGVILSAIFVGDRIHLPQAVGGILVLIGTALTSEYERRQAAAPAQ